MNKLMGLAVALALAFATGQASASLGTQENAKQKLSEPALPMVACRAGQVYYGGGVFPIYGTRGGRTGVIDVLYVDAGCYWEY